MSPDPTIHRFPVKHEGAFVNAYLVETSSGVVAVDGLLQVSAAKEMRAGIDRLGKPLLAAVLTHSHPDHYPGSARSSPAMTSRSTRRRV
jgi:glyoxylase-like metal-dependent hydrolase (beta-lactamase superfamily II)